MRKLVALLGISLVAILSPACAGDDAGDDLVESADQDLSGASLPIGVHKRTSRGYVLTSYIRRINEPSVYVPGFGPATMVGTLPLRKGMETEFVKNYLYIWEFADLLADGLRDGKRFLQMQLGDQLITVRSEKGFVADFEVTTVL